MTTPRPTLPRRLALAGPVAAAALAVTARHPVRAADPEAEAPIVALNQALLAAMQAGQGTPFVQRFERLAPVVERAFDLPGILQASVGPRWSGLPPAQQAQLLEVFRRFTVASYAARFDSYGGERIEVLPEGRTVGADRVVATRIVPAGGEPTRIDYVMRRGPAGWQAVDVLLNGSISQVAVQRSDFRTSVAAGDASALIASLQRKVAELSGGAIPS